MAYEIRAASLCITSGSDDLGWISQATGIFDAKLHPKGELFSRRNPQSARRQEHLWVGNLSPTADATIEELGLAAIKAAQAVRGHSAGANEGLELNFSSLVAMDVCNGSLMLAPETLRRLGELKVMLSFDLVSREDED